MANAAAGNKKDAKPADDKKDVKPVPAFRDKDGALNKLKRSDFPKTIEGKKAHADYMIETWKDRKEDIAASSDPKKKKANKLAKLRKQLEALEKEVQDDNSSKK